MKQERFFENFMLGITEGEIAVEDRALNIAAVHKLTSSAIHEVNIISRCLNHQVFDRRDIPELRSSSINNCIFVAESLSSRSCAGSLSL